MHVCNELPGASHVLQDDVYGCTEKAGTYAVHEQELVWLWPYAKESMQVWQAYLQGKHDTGGIGG